MEMRGSKYSLVSIEHRVDALLAVASLAEPESSSSWLRVL